MTRSHTIQRRHRAPGFTMMEALIALVLLFITILGMGALAGSAVSTNMSAQDRTQANFLAERLLNSIRIEGMAWNNVTWGPSADTNAADSIYMKLLRPLPATGSTGFMEITEKMVGETKAFTPDLKMVAPTANNALYCAHYNLTWKQPGETIEANVRVFWMRRGADPTTSGFYVDCGKAKLPALGGYDPIGNSIADLKCATASGLISRYEDV